MGDFHHPRVTPGLKSSLNVSFSLPPQSGHHLRFDEPTDADQDYQWQGIANEDYKPSYHRYKALECRAESIPYTPAMRYWLRLIQRNGDGCKLNAVLKIVYLPGEPFDIASHTP